MAGVLGKQVAQEPRDPNILMSIPYCRTLKQFRNVEYGKVIVYLSDDLLTDLLEQETLGKFGVYETSYLLPGTGLSDWDIGRGQYRNRVRTLVKPVTVRYDGTLYKEVPLFCRVRGMANPLVVKNILTELNDSLDKYKDHVRNGIAEEWCSQELWRIYPRFEKDCVKPVMVEIDGELVENYDIPSFDMNAIMKELLPHGWDDPWDP